jgi:hypothetical protein
VRLPCSSSPPHDILVSSGFSSSIFCQPYVLTEDISLYVRSADERGAEGFQQLPSQAKPSTCNCSNDVMVCCLSLWQLLLCYWSWMKFTKQGTWSCCGFIGIPDLRLMGLSLMLRWLWLQRCDQSRPWSGLPVVMDRYSKAFVRASTACVVGDSKETFLWTDPWLDGRSLE